MYYTSVVSQQDSAVSGLGLTVSPDSAFSVVPLLPEVLPVANTLTPAHISPRPLPEALPGAVRSSSKSFDNGTIARLSTLRELGDTPQRDKRGDILPRRPRKDKPLPVFHDEDATGNCQIWVDGSLMKVGKPSAGRSQVGGGKRSIVLGFSRASRRRLMQKMAQLRQDSRPLFVTLTYPNEFPLEAAEWKTHFDKWCKRLHRRYPAAGLVWRLEPQKRGAPHFHVLLFGVAIDGELHKWLRQAWYECVGSGDTKHLYHGADIQVLRSVRGVRSYVSKYIAKVQTPPARCNDDGEVLPVPDWSKVGRWWGVRYGDNLPWSEVVGGKILTYGQSVRLMRHLRRYLKAQGVRVSGSMPGMTVFVNVPRQWFDNLDKLVC